MVKRRSKVFHFDAVNIEREFRPTKPSKKYLNQTNFARKIAKQRNNIIPFLDIISLIKLMLFRCTESFIARILQMRCEFRDQSLQIFHTTNFHNNMYDCEFLLMKFIQLFLSNQIKSAT